MSEIVVNGKPLALPCAWRLADLVDALGYAGKRVAVELNGEIVPRARHPEVLLSARDRVEIVVAVGGG